MADLTESERRMLRQIHYPVIWNIGEFNHDDAKHLRKAAMSDRPGAPDMGAVHIIEAALPDHVEDARFRGCALDCHVEVEAATCAKCGLWMDEDGELHGTPWPCPTALVLQLDLHVPPCTCRWAIRSRGLHDPECAYMAATHGSDEQPCPDCGGRGRLRPVPTSVITFKCPTCDNEQPTADALNEAWCDVCGLSRRCIACTTDQPIHASDGDDDR